MEYITDDSLLEIISRLRPQVHLNALACVAPWLTERINRLRTTHVWKPREGVRLPLVCFAGITQVTPFQDACLNELFFNRQTAVPDADNAQIIANGLYQYLASDHYLTYVNTTTKCAQTVQALLSVRNQVQINIVDNTVTFNNCMDAYTICISDYPLPVDEYTALWAFRNSSTPRIEKRSPLGPLLRGLQGSPIEHMFIESTDPKYPLHIPLKRALQIGGTRLYPDMHCISSGKNILYRDLAGYDIYLCQCGPDVARIASLLMQFSPCPKKLFVYNHNFFFPQQYTLAMAAKRRFQYRTGVHGMDLERQPFSIATLPIFKTMNEAEYCLAECGYERSKYQNYEKWVESVSGKGNLKLDQFPPFVINPILLWIHVDPQADWKDVIKTASSKALFYPLEAEAELVALRDLERKIKTSLKITRGKVGTESFTLSEAKDLCKEKGISGSGSRKVVLERLLVHVREEMQNI